MAAGGITTDHIIVQFAPGAAGRPAPPNAFGRSVRYSAGELSLPNTVRGLCDRWRVTGIHRAYPFAFARPDLAAQFGLDRTYVVEVPPGTDALTMAREFREFDADVDAASVDVVGGIAAVPNDSDFGRQWNMHNVGQQVCNLQTNPVQCFFGTVDADIDAPEAWSLHTGDPGTVTIAIIDSGVSPHTEFGSRLIAGYNTNDPENPSLTTDGVGHGTHVAGIATASGNNGAGVAGVTWGANIMPVRVTNSFGQGTALQGANGLIWAVDHGADVCNMSLQYYPVNQAAADLVFFENAVNYAYASGAVLVAAAGNNLGNQVAYPARLEKCLAITATTAFDAYWNASNFGDEVDLAAPGEAIWSTWTSDGYQMLSGTSMASPHVTGLAALLLSYQPQLTNDGVRAILETSAEDRGAVGWDSRFGFGRINAFDALTLATLPVTAIVFSDPPHGAIDARQPSRVDGSQPAGWDAIELTMYGDVSTLAAGDFSLVADPLAALPSITTVAAAGQTVTVQLDGPIPVGSWTTLTHILSGTSVRLGYLPGDVNASHLVSASDISALIDSLNRVVGRTRPIYATDANRSGAANAQDITQLINLLNGAGVYPIFNGRSLPP
ncbi:MAG: S8 family serine peptidase [Planctomycetes bacterium]|nr:S8 family serine peptidase [Planctomycetota bacterium]